MGFLHHDVCAICYLLLCFTFHILQFLYGFCNDLSISYLPGGFFQLLPVRLRIKWIRGSFVVLKGMAVVQLLKHDLFQTRDVREYHFPAPCMELAQPFHVCAYLAVDGMLYRNRIIVSGMYVVKIIFCDREHVLQEEGGAFSVKFSKDNSEASAVFFACLSWMALNLSTRLLNGTIQSREVFSSFRQ